MLIGISSWPPVDEALRLPGKEGFLALMNLRQELSVRRSSLEPEGGLPAIDDTELPQQDVPMAARRELLDVG